MLVQRKLSKLHCLADHSDVTPDDGNGGEKGQKHLLVNLPHFVIHFLSLEYFQGTHLVQNLRLVKTNKVVDYHVRGPNMLRQKIEMI